METSEVEPDAPPQGDAEDARAGRDRAGIQSIEVGAQLLVALTRASRAMALGDLARAAGMHPSKAHRYLVSLQRVGAVSQDPLTGRYELGPFALRLGLASLNRVEAVSRARPLLASLRDRTGHTIGIAVWSERGPTVVHWERAGGAPGVNLRIGDVMPMLNSATGRLFGAYLPIEQTLPLVERELHTRANDDLPGLPRSLTDYYRLCEDVRAEGAAWVSGGLLPGVSALSLPVFGARGELALVLIALNLQPLFLAGPGGELEKTLRTFVDQLSAMLRSPVSPASPAGRGGGRRSR
ncbi:IclR family transcriptional regulator [Ralstonia solanacearum]|uniref:Putative transcription regulator protein, IclR family (IclR) n=1 Tax=Ralstonia solanacearum CFBP2957 TaxID=859656 RepID=D8P3T7_RALSL|nr:IclR family transcriptional regulator [Ralstonia solanacearum]OAI59329.1 IclR family transcriptional regulator [Ralstonia solanacearum]CBJ53573.1 putative transcription regulator protein, IclR family (iclR) [Ralstonia solanacearum CFBP2957]